MVNFSDLTTEELNYLRSKWDSEETEMTKEKARKTTRLNDRLSRTAEDAVAKSELETELQDMQAVLTELQNASASAATIATVQGQVDSLQVQVDSFGTSTGHVSNTDAMLYQIELDELDALKALRTSRIADIDTELGN